MEVEIIFVTIITAVISSYLTYYFSVRSKKYETILKFKEEKYSNLIILLQGFVGLTANNKTRKLFFEEQYRSWIYCSDNVVKAINEMLFLIRSANGSNPDYRMGRDAIGKIILEMRKDLLGKTKLKTDDFQYTDVSE